MYTAVYTAVEQSGCGAKRALSGGPRLTDMMLLKEPKTELSNNNGAHMLYRVALGCTRI